MRLRLLAAVALFFSVGVVAHADPLVPFRLNVNFTNGGTLAGIINLDSSPYAFDSTANLIYTNPYGTQYAVYGTNTATGSIYGAPSLQFNSRYPGIGIAFSNYATGGLCTGSSSCGLGTYVLDGNFVFASSGTFAPNTPEPSSIALLGTGMCGLIGVVRRRRVK